MKVCYVFAGDADSSYLQMLQVSVSSLKACHPDAEVICLTTEDAYSIAIGRLGALEVAVQSIRGLRRDARHQSRSIKTRLLEFVQDDFLYLDVDTIVLRPLEMIWSNEFDIAMALDRNRGNPAPHFPGHAASLYDRLGWNWPVPYFNSGVMAVRNNDNSRTLFHEWHLRWMATEELGVVLDQPALNSAIDFTNVNVKRLGVEYNAMIDADPTFAKHAKVLHFYTRGGQPEQGTLLARLMRSLDDGNPLDFDQIRQCRKRGHPWGTPYEPWRLIRSQNYLLALYYKAKQFVS